jgi:hypothetical protein
MEANGFHRDLRAALLVVAGILAGMAAGLPLAARLAGPELLLTAVAPCPAQRAGGSCILCGMTTAVCALARGDLAAAQAAHPAALPLVAAGWLLIIARGRRRVRAITLPGGTPCRSSV